MKNNNIYELLNKFEMNTDDMEDLSEFEKEKIKKNFKNTKRRNSNMKKVVGFSLAVVLGLGIIGQTNLGKVVYATAKSGIDDINYSINSIFNRDENLDMYSNIINKSTKDKGIEVKLTDVVLDEKELMILNLIDVNNPNIQSVNMDYNLRINGRKIKHYSASGYTNKLNNNVFESFYSIGIEDLKLDKENKFDLEIDKIYLGYKDNDEYREKTINGHWNYTFMANSVELQKNTIFKEINKEIVVEDDIYKLEKININPINQKIIASSNNGLNHSIKLEGVDDKGREIIFEIDRANGKDIIFRLSSSTTIDKDVEFLKLTAYSQDIPKENGRIEESFKKASEEFIINIK